MSPSCGRWNVVSPPAGYRANMTGRWWLAAGGILAMLAAVVLLHWTTRSWEDVRDAMVEGARTTATSSGTYEGFVFTPRPGQWSAQLYFGNVSGKDLSDRLSRSIPTDVALRCGQASGAGGKPISDCTIFMRSWLFGWVPRGSVVVSGSTALVTVEKSRIYLGLPVLVAPGTKPQ